MKFKTIEWKKDSVRILDQRRLPHEVVYLDCRDTSSVAKAIRTLAVRGAPAIGVAAAMGIAMGARTLSVRRPEVFRKKLEEVCEEMRQTRPTAVNLFWAVGRMERVIRSGRAAPPGLANELEREALRIYREDVEINRNIGKHGRGLIRNGAGVLTHCNAGALATAGHGTALGVLFSAWAAGKRFKVFVDETRPLLQGARLTAWELVQAKIPATVITDNMAGWLMKKGKVDLVLVGADRIARNGDTANKIGTYSLAVLAKHHRIPLYVVAPTSTIDLALKRGEDIPIEERAEEEVTHFFGKRVTPRRVKAFNPAFDVTPYPLIEAIVTERGILRKPFEAKLKKIGSKGSRDQEA